MTFRTKRKTLSEKLNFDLIIEYEKLFHYEDLFIGKLDKIKAEYNNKINYFKISTIILFFLPILSFSDDVIGIKILKKIPYNQPLINFILLLVPCVLSILTVYKAIKIKESLNFEFIKEEFNQERIFLNYINEKAKVQNVLDECNHHEVVKSYCSGKKTMVTFLKSNFKAYINDYFRKNYKDIDCYDISIFLTEMIISKRLIKNEIIRSKHEDQFVYIIDRTNIIKVIHH